MFLKKLLCLILCIGLLLLAGCGDDGKKVDKDDKVNIESAEVRDTMNLLFCNSDTLNPYIAETEINRQLCRLIFDPLVKTDNEFEVKYCLAESVKVQGKECVAKLRNAKFSDGANLTASDVVYSFNLAKKSSTSYAYKLYNVSSATAVDSKTVKFSLIKSDPYCANVLDFPILKTDSDKRTDSDGVVLPSIGCGRYAPTDDYSKLILNEKYYGDKGSIKTIRLENAPDTESISHYIEIGAADMYYTDISDGDIIRMSALKYNINLNNFVYIGINGNYPLLKNNDIRYAISSALNRNSICSKAYYNNAIAATGFFNPLWKETASVQNIQTEANLQITVENLSEIGYNSLDAEGYYVNSLGNRINLTLLVNSDNAMRVLAAKEIASQLKSAGINITVIEKGYEAYLAALRSGGFQLYLGEVTITPNMDMTNLVAPGTAASYGVVTPTVEIPSSDETGETVQTTITAPANSLSVINGFYSGVNTITDVATALQTEMPMIPVCYRTGVLFCDENIENIKNSSASDIYFSIESYRIIKK